MLTFELYVDEESGAHEEGTKGPFPELFVLPHTETAMMMDITPENAVEVCPHIPDILEPMLAPDEENEEGGPPTGATDRKILREWAEVVA